MVSVQQKGFSYPDDLTQHDLSRLQCVATRARVSLGQVPLCVVGDEEGEDGEVSNGTVTVFYAGGYSQEYTCIQHFLDAVGGNLDVGDMITKVENETFATVHSLIFFYQWDCSSGLCVFDRVGTAVAGQVHVGSAFPNTDALLWTLSVQREKVERIQISGITLVVGWLRGNYLTYRTSENLGFSLCERPPLSPSDVFSI